jgi:hypothetical protein
MTELLDNGDFDESYLNLAKSFFEEESVNSVQIIDYDENTIDQSVEELRENTRLDMNKERRKRKRKCRRTAKNKVNINELQSNFERSLNLFNTNGFNFELSSLYLEEIMGKFTEKERLKTLKRTLKKLNLIKKKKLNPKRKLFI